MGDVSVKIVCVVCTPVLPTYPTVTLILSSTSPMARGGAIPVVFSSWWNCPMMAFDPAPGATVKL